MPSLTPIPVNAIVINKEHPEYGYGIVKRLDEDPFGDTVIEVSFDHKDTIERCSDKHLSVCLSEETAFAEERLGNLEAFRRKVLAGMIISENNRTGAFMRARLKPLPHQVHLMNRLFSGKRIGHLLADDVGLGKTIEAGLILSQYHYDSRLKKILILCPASLTMQWQDEMIEHFGLRFSIANRDFKVNSEAGWEGRQLIIASIDTLKQNRYFKHIQAVSPFDLVIVDEAHRLSVRHDIMEGGYRFTESYKFVESLVEQKLIEFEPTSDGAPRSPHLLLLSATPHQGDDLRFAYLLKLIRPDLFPDKEHPKMLERLNAETLMECVTRTPKSKAIDWEGKSIFKGHQSFTQETKITQWENDVLERLKFYIRKSMDARSEQGRAQALIIELVMNTFHKIAASSWAALRLAMVKRYCAINGIAWQDYDKQKPMPTVQSVNGEIAKLKSKMVTLKALVSPTSTTEDDDTFDSDQLENALKSVSFFEDEALVLDEIITAIDDLPMDSKRGLFDRVMAHIETHEPGAKVLIFTQYYGTQAYIAEILKARYPNETSVIINGSLTVEERMEARRQFEDSARFMISTEAGGEGVNLQKASYTMINFDIPWNPMRLQQRIGRLDRYGQKKVVSVYNLTVQGSWDSRITLRILERLQVIQKTMGQVVEDAEDYQLMILGRISEELEDSAISSINYNDKPELTDEEIDRKLKEAKSAIFSTKLKGIDETAFKSLNEVPRPVLNSEVFKKAFEASLKTHEIILQGTRTEKKEWVHGVFQFIPPDAFKDTMRASKTRYVVFDKERFSEVREIKLGKARGQDIKPQLAGFGDSVTDWIMASAFWAKEDERYFTANLAPNKTWTYGSGWLRIASLRWRGKLRALNAPDAILAVFVNKQGEAKEIEYPELLELLETLQESGAEKNEHKQTPCDGATAGTESAKLIVQKRLKEVIGNDQQARATAGWSWLAVVRVTD